MLIQSHKYCTKEDEEYNVDHNPFQAAAGTGAVATSMIFCDPGGPSKILELNFSTALKFLYVWNHTSMGVLDTTNVTPSAQGGVVNEPEYWARLARCIS
jgi:hypothetical protein